MFLGKSQRDKDIRRVASVAAFNKQGLLLCGKRNDNGRWTLPGGHLEPGEKPEKGAVRELMEEAGLKPDSLEFLGEGVVESRGEKIVVYCYRVEVTGEPCSDQDPDEECDEWKFVSVEEGLPEEIAGNLHSRKNITLRLLGLQEGDVDPLEKMAIRDIKAGKSKGKTKEPMLGEMDVYDYSHVLSPEHKQLGYSIRVSHKKDDTGQIFESGLWFKNKRVGHVRASNTFTNSNSAIEPHSEITPEHRGKGLGTALYEALFRHAQLNGVKEVHGGHHSVDAMRVHQRLASKHGLEYKPIQHDPLDFEGTGSFKPYKYTIKNELEKSQTPPKFPKMGLPDNRRETPIVSTPLELQNKTRSIIAQGFQRTAQQNPELAEQIEQHPIEYAYERNIRAAQLGQNAVGAVSGVPGSKTGFVRDTNLMAREIAKNPYVGEMLYGHDKAPNATVQHENLHQMFGRVQEKHGPEGRANLAFNLYHAIPWETRRYLDNYIKERAPHYHGNHEEMLATLHNYLNNPGERVAYKVHGRFSDAAMRTIDTQLKRAHKIMHTAAGAADDSWAKFRRTHWAKSEDGMFTLSKADETDSLKDPQYEDEIFRMLESNTPLERQLALKLEGVQPKHLIRAVDKVNELADLKPILNHPAMDEIVVDHIVNKKPESAGHLGLINSIFKFSPKGFVPTRHIPMAYQNVFDHTPANLRSSGYFQGLMNDIARHELTPPAVLSQMWDDFKLQKVAISDWHNVNSSIATSIFENKNIPSKILDDFLRNTDWNDSNWNLLKPALGNPNCPDEWSEKALFGERKTFCKYASYRPNLPNHIILKVIDNVDRLDNEDYGVVEPLLLRQHSLDSQIIDKLVDHEYGYLWRIPFHKEFREQIKPEHINKLLMRTNFSPYAVEQVLSDTPQLITPELSNQILSHSNEETVTRFLSHPNAQVSNEQLLHVIEHSKDEESVRAAMRRAYDANVPGIATTALRNERVAAGRLKLGHPSTTEAEWHAALQSEHGKYAVMDASRHAPPSVIPILLQDYKTYGGLAQNPLLSDEQLTHLFNRIDEGVRNENIPLSWLNVPKIVKSITQHPNVSASTLGTIARRGMQLATTPERYENLASSCLSALANPKISQDVLSEAVNNPHPRYGRIARYVTKNEALSPEHLRKLIENRDELPGDAELQLARHSNLTEELQHQLLDKYMEDYLENDGAAGSEYFENLLANHNLAESTLQKVHQFSKDYKIRRLQRSVEDKLVIHSPDAVSDGRVKMKFGTNKLRKIRDLILSRGVKEVHPKQLPPGDWSAGRNAKGNIDADKIQQWIDSQPETHWNYTHDKWDGAQKHSSEVQKVFQMNLTNEHVKRMKEAGVWNTFRKMHDDTMASGHPVKPHTIGWVRYTMDKEPSKARELDAIRDKDDFADRIWEIAKNKLSDDAEFDDFYKHHYAAHAEISDALTSDKPLDVTKIRPYVRWIDRLIGKDKNPFHSVDLSVHPDDFIDHFDRHRSDVARKLRQKFNQEDEANMGFWKDFNIVNLKGDDINSIEELANHPYTQFVRQHIPDAFKELEEAVQEGKGKPPKAPPNIFIDEIQSDFGQSFARQLAAQGRSQQGYDEAVRRGYTGTREDFQALADEQAKQYPEEDFQKISNILFGGKKANEVIGETFLQHLRDKGMHEAGVQIHSVESKHPISLGDKEKDAPAHFKHTYGQMPERFGAEPSTYGKFKTQQKGVNYKHLTNYKDTGQGAPTYELKVRKYEDELESFLAKALKLEHLDVLNDIDDGYADEVSLDIDDKEVHRAWAK